VRGHTFFDRFLLLLQHGGSVRKVSKHRPGLKSKDWQEKRKVRRKMAKASRKRNRCSR